MKNTEKDASICQREIKLYTETHRNTPLTQFSPSSLQLLVLYMMIKKNTFMIIYKKNNNNNKKNTSLVSLLTPRRICRVQK